DNYRVVASTSKTWVDGLQASPTPRNTTVQDKNGTVVPPGGSVSGLLTVWRTLHLELSRMDTSTVTQADLEAHGDRTSVENHKLITTQVNFVDDLHPKGNDWRGAHLKPCGPDPNEATLDVDNKAVFRATANEAHKVSITKGDLSGPAADCSVSQF